MLGIFTRLLIATLGFAPILGCGGDGTNPFIIDSIPAQDTTSDPNTGAGATPDNRFLFSPSENLTLNSVDFHETTNQLVLNNLPFDNSDITGGIYEQVQQINARTIEYRNERAGDQPFARGPAQQAALARNYAQVARANPLMFELEFRAGPNSNINNAPKSDSLIFNGIKIAASGASLALSGTEISYGLKLRHKRPLNDGTALSFGARLNAINYRLSDSAKAQAPDACPSDFAFYEVGIDASYDAKPTANAADALRFEVGANWYGGERLTNFAKVAAERHFRWGNAATGAIEFGIRRNERLDADERSSTVASATLKRTQTLSGGSRLSWLANISNTASRSALIEHSSVSANITYAPAKPILGATAEFGVSFGQRKYAQIVSIFGPDSRKDTQAGIRAQFLLEKINVYGFAPLVALSASSTESKINRYDIRQTSVSLGIASVF